MNRDQYQQKREWLNAAGRPPARHGQALAAPPVLRAGTARAGAPQGNELDESPKHRAAQRQGRM